MTTSINGRDVLVTGEHAEKALASHIFKDWADRLNPRFLVQAIEFQSVDFINRAGEERVFFIKFKAKVSDHQGKSLPGIVFLRGGSVAMLPILNCEGKQYTILVNQPRFCAGQFPICEIPAGMIDGEGDFAGAAARELDEELGLKIRKDELIDLTGIFYGERWRGIFPSVGILDEFIGLYAFVREVTPEELAGFVGKTTGVAAERECITLSVIPLGTLLHTTPDAKAICALALYQAYQACR